MCALDLNEKLNEKKDNWFQLLISNILFVVFNRAVGQSKHFGPYSLLPLLFEAIKKSLKF